LNISLGKPIVLQPFQLTSTNFPCQSSQAGTTQTVRLLLSLPKSRQEATCKTRVQFSAQYPRVFNIKIFMQRKLKAYGQQFMFWHS